LQNKERVKLGIKAQRLKCGFYCVTY